MRINAKGPLYRFTYWPVRPVLRPTKTVSICAFVANFVGTVVYTIAIGIVLGVFAVIFFALVQGIWELVPFTYRFFMAESSRMWLAFMIVGGIVLGILFLIAAFLGYFFWSDSESSQVFHAYLRAKKNRFCPVIEIG